MGRALKERPIRKDQGWKDGGPKEKGRPEGRPQTFRRKLNLAADDVREVDVGERLADQGHRVIRIKVAVVMVCAVLVSANTITSLPTCTAT